jgi:hypothetical protein
MSAPGEGGSVPNAGDVKKIPDYIIEEMGGEETIAEIKAHIPGNPDLVWNPQTGEIFIEKPGGGIAPTGEFVQDYGVTLE